MKHWKLLNSGAAWDLCNPDPSVLHVLDIAVPLSRIPRWTGAGDRVIRVAEHCVHVSRMVLEMTGGDRVAAAQGLLHEGDEPIMNDIPTPVKELIPAIRELAQIQQRAVFQRFDLPWPMHPAVKAADEVSFCSEARINMPPTPFDYYDKDCVWRHPVHFWDEDESRRAFLKEGQDLGLW